MPISLDFISRWTLKVKDATAFPTRDWRIPTLIVPFLGHILVGTASGQLLLQYCSKRYNLTFSDGTLLLVVFSAVRVLVLALILPYISTAAMRIFHLTGLRKDLYLARASQVFVVVGWVFIGLSPNIPSVAIGMVVAALGQGALMLVRSFLTSLVPVSIPANSLGRSTETLLTTFTA